VTVVLKEAEANTAPAYFEAGEDRLAAQFAEGFSTRSTM
jgi:hypothetical protein